MFIQYDCRVELFILIYTSNSLRPLVNIATSASESNVGIVLETTLHTSERQIVYDNRIV